MSAITKTQAPAMAMVLRPTTFDQLVQFANMAAKSKMVPVAYQNKPEDIMLAIQMGSELNLPPMQALQNIAVINGRPALWGDAVLALVKAHPAYVSCEETTTGDGDARVATCKIVRQGEPPVVRSFSVTEAKAADLWGKQGPWQKYPARMLQMRARGFAARDAFPDALRGLISAEEAQDIPRDDFTGPTIQGVAEPVHETQPEPVAKPRPRLVRELLDEFQAAFDAAQTAEDVDAVLARADVQTAQDKLQNGARERLIAMIQAALARTSPADGVWESGEAQS